MVRGVNFWWNFWRIFKNKDFANADLHTSHTKVTIVCIYIFATYGQLVLVFSNYQFPFWFCSFLKIKFYTIASLKLFCLRRFMHTAILSLRCPGLWLSSAKSCLISGNCHESVVSFFRQYSKNAITSTQLKLNAVTYENFIIFFRVRFSLAIKP